MVRRQAQPSPKALSFTPIGGRMPCIEDFVIDRPLALIVDADEDTRTMYALRLEADGMVVVEAPNGQQALATATRLLPDIITTDLRMMNGDGMSLCRDLKTHGQTKGIPVIVVTGDTRPTQRQEALELGCVAVLPKPCLPDDLLAEIRRVLQLSDGVN